MLANLCVSYIMTSQNEEAEELMKRIEREEERAAYAEGPGGAPQPPHRREAGLATLNKFFHLCIVNLVIGTLYCAKGTRTLCSLFTVHCSLFILRRSGLHEYEYSG